MRETEVETKRARIREHVMMEDEETMTQLQVLKMKGGMEVSSRRRE